MAPDIEYLIIESRPEFITEGKLELIKNLTNKKTVEIGVGLESHSDNIRSLCINKGFQYSEYINATKLIKSFQIKVLTYLTIKPLFLTISESIYDVVNSIINIQDISDAISLEPTSIQKGTLVEFFFKRGLFSIPKGWIVRDILTKIEQLNILNNFDLRIGGFEFFPIPDLVINNCNNCSEELYDAIDLYNTNKDLTAIKKLRCDCEHKYKNTMIFEDEHVGKVLLEKRISNLIAQELTKNTAA